MTTPAMAMALVALLACAVGVAGQDAVALSGDPNSRFPDCVCSESLVRSPYRIALTNTTRTTQGFTYCFDFEVVACLIDNPCCYSTLTKLELPVPLQCHNSVLGVTFNGAPFGWTWTSVFPGQNRHNLKINQLHLDRASAASASICIALGDTCPDLTTFCFPQTGTCQVALFDEAPFPCCPISMIAGPLPPGRVHPPSPPPPRMSPPLPPPSKFY
ncbi:hypothetical protein FOA52_011648 [Chlamydomonas sp. UWO 241]|nr:hypothetical protein FOA52_011648 [Chlamydomonas sp. UWO 241]